jgi:hypothetical protein
VKRFISNILGLRDAKFQSEDLVPLFLAAICFANISFQILAVDRDILINDEWRFLAKYMKDPSQWMSLSNLYNIHDGALLPLYKWFLGLSFANADSGFFHIRPMQLAGALGYSIWILTLASTARFLSSRSKNIQPSAKSLSTPLILLLAYPFMYSHSLHTLIAFNKFCFFVTIALATAVLRTTISTPHEKTRIFLILSLIAWISLAGGVINISMMLVTLCLCAVAMLLTSRKLVAQISIFSMVAIVLLTSFWLQNNTRELNISFLVDTFHPIRLVASFSAWHFAPILDIYREPNRLPQLTQDSGIIIGFLIFAVTMLQFWACARILIKKGDLAATIPLFFIVSSWISAYAIWLGGGFNKPAFFVAQHRYVEMQLLGWLGLFYSFTLTNQTASLPNLVRKIILGITLTVFITGILEFNKSSRIATKRVEQIERLITSNDMSIECWRKIGFWRPLDEEYCEPLRQFVISR